MQVRTNAVTITINLLDYMSNMGNTPIKLDRAMPTETAIGFRNEAVVVRLLWCVL